MQVNMRRFDLFVQEENLFSAMTPYALQANEQMFFFRLLFVSLRLFFSHSVCDKVYNSLEKGKLKIVESHTQLVFQALFATLFPFGCAFV